MTLKQNKDFCFTQTSLEKNLVVYSHFAYKLQFGNANNNQLQIFFENLKNQEMTFSRIFKLNKNVSLYF